VEADKEVAATTVENGKITQIKNTPLGRFCALVKVGWERHTDCHENPLAEKPPRGFQNSFQRKHGK